MAQRGLIVICVEYLRVQPEVGTEPVAGLGAQPLPGVLVGAWVVVSLTDTGQKGEAGGVWRWRLGRSVAELGVSLSASAINRAAAANRFVS